MFARITQGFRTLATAGALVVIGGMSAVGSLDLTPLVSMFVKNPASLGATMVVIGLVFGYLRFITHTSAFQNLAGEDADGHPLKRNCDQGE